MSGRFIVIDGDELCGPYDYDEARELVDRGGGFFVPVSVIKHAGIMHNKLANAVRELQIIVEDLAEGLRWANGDYDQHEESDE